MYKLRMPHERRRYGLAIFTDSFYHIRRATQRCIVYLVGSTADDKAFLRW